MKKKNIRHDRRTEQVLLRILIAILITAISALTLSLGLIIEEHAKDDEVDEKIIMSRDWGYDETESLTKLAMTLADDQDEETKMLVMLVALNRVWSDGFPRNVSEVTDEMVGGCYTDVKPDGECRQAEARIHYEGWDKSQGALYICLSEDIDADEDMYCNEHEFLYTSGKYNFYR